MAARMQTRFRSRGLLGLGFAAALILAACGAAGGGTGAAQTNGKTSGSGSAAAGGAPSGMPTSTSLKGWQSVPGSGGVGVQVDTTMGDPKGPSLQLPGDKSYIWADLKKPIDQFSFDVNTQGLFDFIFGASSTGQGYLFRIDTRGGSNYSGFAELEDWSDWSCPQTGSTSDPANTWIHVSLVIKGTNVTATETGPGGLNEVNTFNGSTDGCNTMSDGTVLPTTLGPYKPFGTAFGFQGDGLGATSYTYIANFT